MLTLFLFYGFHECLRTFPEVLIKFDWSFQPLERKDWADSRPDSKIYTLKSVSLTRLPSSALPPQTWNFGHLHLLLSLSSMEHEGTDSLGRFEVIQGLWGSQGSHDARLGLWALSGAEFPPAWCLQIVHSPKSSLFILGPSGHGRETRP